MDTIQVQPSVQSARDDLREEIESLRHLIVSVLVLLVVATGTMAIFLYMQKKYAAEEVLRSRAVEHIAQFEGGESRKMDEFVASLAEFGKTHPDIVPLLARYGIAPAPGAGTPMPPANAPKK